MSSVVTHTHIFIGQAVAVVIFSCCLTLGHGEATGEEYRMGGTPDTEADGVGFGLIFTDGATGSGTGIDLLETTLSLHARGWTFVWRKDMLTESCFR